jgi:di/tricarboxylate transporter
MITVPNAHAIAAILITVIVFWLFARGRVRIELISLSLIAALAVGFYFFPFEQEGRYTGMEVAFGGFSHEALVAICCLMLLGRGLLSTGALRPAVRILARVWRLNRTVGLLFTLIVCGGLSMFVNDTPVLVLALPILLELANHSGVSASRTLMPVNSAILIGGMSTTVGTSTNLLVVSIAQDLGMPTFGVFHFTGIALASAVIALPYVWLVMPLLLRSGSVAAAKAPRTFDASLHITEASGLVKTPLSRVSKRIGEGLTVLGIERKGIPIPHAGEEGHVESGDVVLVTGAIAPLRHASEELSSPLVRPELQESMRTFGDDSDEGRITVEMVIGAGSSLIGQSVRSARLADRYGIAVIGIHRAAGSLRSGARYPTSEPLEVGDIVLIEGTPSRIRELEISESALILEGASQSPRTELANLALLIMAGVIVIAASRIVPIAIAALAGCIGMFATGCLRFERADRALSGQVILLVAASIALGRTLVETGAAEWLGMVFAFALQALPPAGMVAAVMIFAALLTNFISNATAAAVATPIAFNIAAQLAIPAEPLIAAVLFGANLCFVTPMAYQTNLMIMAAGEYRFSDYVRAGLPLAILLILALSMLLVGEYGL